jgi:hypothetical protein
MGSNSPQYHLYEALSLLGKWMLGLLLPPSDDNVGAVFAVLSLAVGKFIQFKMSSISS